jgi:YfiH family protein
MQTIDPEMTDNEYIKNLCLISSDVLNGAGGIRHFFTTRKGGMSEGVWASLNIGINRGDKREHVEENFRRIARAVGFDVNNIAVTMQVHGDTVRTVDKGGSPYDPVPFPCDALITNKPGIALFAYGADCVTILLHDRTAGCIAAVHAGWRGTANGILKKTIEGLTAEYGSKPENVLAAIGPSIGRCCFEVDKAVYDALKETYPEIDEYTDIKGIKYYPDLKALNRVMLIRCGVLPDNISVSDECTKCNKELFWSHRRDGSDRGLQGAVIVMEGQVRETCVK